jgi:hypothetical protein
MCKLPLNSWLSSVADKEFKECIGITPEGKAVIMDTAFYLIPSPYGVPNDGGVRWRAPELLVPTDEQSHQARTKSSDLYSLGMTFYEVRVFCASQLAY